MASNINNVTVSGNLTKDLEIRATPSGYPIGSCSVAVNERRKNPEGAYEDYANYFDFTILGERAQKLAQFLTKGTKVTICGSLKQRRWQDKQTGQNRSAVEILVNDLEFMSRQQQPQGYAPQQAPAPAAYRQAPAPQSYAPQPQAPQGYAPQPAYQQQAPQGYAPQQAPAPQPAQQQLPAVYDADIPF